MRRLTLARLREYPSREWWTQVFTRAAASDFLRGGGGLGWRADYDWFVRDPDNSAKVFEGRYDNPRQPTARDRRRAAQDEPLRAWYAVLRALHDDHKIETEQYRRFASTVSVQRDGRTLVVGVPTHALFGELQTPDVLALLTTALADVEETTTLRVSLLREEPHDHASI